MARNGSLDRITALGGPCSSLLLFRPCFAERCPCDSGSPSAPPAGRDARAKMLILILGLVIFIAVHLFTTRRAARRAAIDRMGENGYKLAYTALSIIGLILIVVGFGSARAEG